MSEKIYAEIKKTFVDNGMPLEEVLIIACKATAVLNNFIVDSGLCDDLNMYVKNHQDKEDMIFAVNVSSGLCLKISEIIEELQ